MYNYKFRNISNKIIVLSWKVMQLWNRCALQSLLFYISSIFLVYKLRKWYLTTIFAYFIRERNFFPVNSLKKKQLATKNLHYISGILYYCYRKIERRRRWTPALEPKRRRTSSTSTRRGNQWSLCLSKSLQPYFDEKTTQKIILMNPHFFHKHSY